MRAKVFDIDRKAAIFLLCCFCAFVSSCIPSARNERSLGVSVLEVGANLGGTVNETNTGKKVEQLIATTLKCMGPSRFVAELAHGRSPLQFMFTASTNGYLYLVEEGTSGRVRILSWEKEGETLYFAAKSGLPILYPGGGVKISYDSDGIGENRYIALLSRKPIDGFTDKANDEDIRVTIRELEYEGGQGPDTTSSAADIYTSSEEVLIARFTINVQEKLSN